MPSFCPDDSLPLVVSSSLIISFPACIVIPSPDRASCGRAFDASLPEMGGGRGGGGERLAFPDRIIWIACRSPLPSFASTPFSPAHVIRSLIVWSSRLVIRSNRRESCPHSMSSVVLLPMMSGCEAWSVSGWSCRAIALLLVLQALVSGGKEVMDVSSLDSTTRGSETR